MTSDVMEPPPGFARGQANFPASHSIKIALKGLLASGGHEVLLGCNFVFWTRPVLDLIRIWLHSFGTFWMLQTTKWQAVKNSGSSKPGIF